MNLSQRITTLVAVLLLTAGMVARADDADWRFAGVERMVAVSDIHGDYGALVKTLRNAGVIDATGTWAGGRTHLVVVGDILDRGPDSRRALDLLMALEPQADRDGGKVHVLLGNHEAMNLIGDLRYVSDSEYQAFASQESIEERDHWFAEYTRRSTESDGIASVSREEFDKAYPPGYFAHRRSFAADGVYGKWLLGKPIMIIIDGTAFVHGGVYPEFAELGLQGINGRLRSDLIRYAQLLQVMYAEGILLPTDNFEEQLRRLDQHVPPVGASAALRDDIGTARELSRSEIHSPYGPLWYRGNLACSALVGADQLAASLRKIGADRIVEGHTTSDNHRIVERYGGLVIGIDTGMYADFFGGSGNALVIEGNTLATVNEASSDPGEVLAYPRRVGQRPAGFIADDELEEILAHGEIVATKADPEGSKILEISDGSHVVEGVFIPRTRRNQYPDVAAYRLDRLLGLEMVPVTVRRRVGSENGSVRYRVPDSIDDRTRVASDIPFWAYCPFEWQTEAMFAFDALINNAGRFQTTIRYSVDNWQLFSVDHSRAFEPSHWPPSHVTLESLVINDSWRAALSSITDDVLARELGDFLTKRQIAALGSRRDALLELGQHR